MSKYSDLKFLQIIDYRCDGIEDDKFLSYREINTIMVETEKGLKPFGKVGPFKAL
jgi:hypothetical protein